VTTLELPPVEWDDMSLFEQLALLPEDTVDMILADLIRRGIDLTGPEVMLRPDQLSIVHDGESWISLFSAGRGAGKTRCGAAWINDRAKANPGCQIILLGRTVADVRDVMINGEALALDTPVATPEGFITMGEVRPGDLVLGSDGEPTKVLWVSEIHHDRPCYKVTFKDGESIVADAEHKWTTWTHQARRFRSTPDSKHQPAVVTTEQIRETLIHQKQLNHAIPNIAPIGGDDADLPIPPYTLGAWLGDGHTHHAAITTMDSEVLDGVIADGFRIREWPSAVDNGQASTYGVLGLSAQLKLAGLLADKHVPEIYFRASYQQRLHLLQGLIDTDGSVSTDGQVEFCNTNEALADGVAQLVATLGMRASKTVRPSSDGKKPLYRVQFRTGIPVVTIQRKKERLRTPKSPESMYRYIKSVEPVDSVPVRCIAVDADDHLFAVGHTLVMTHNSGIIHTAPRDFVPVYTPSLRRLEWPNGSIAMTYSADSPSQLRGPQGHFAWADELAAFPVKPDSSGATAWDNCLLATRLGDRPQLLVTTTPKRTGVMRELYRMAELDPRVVLHQASTLSNRTNLSPEYIKAIFDRYAGTHLEMQELFGELVGDAPGALWRSSDIVVKPMPEIDLRTITVIGVDPAVEANGDNTGIVLATGTREPSMQDRRAWVREDRTMNGAPDEWAAAVHGLWVENPGSIVVVEGNQGGQLLKMVLHQLDPAMPVAIVKAISSKSARAEPIVMAYRQRRVEHIDNFPLLEEEMTGWEPEVSRWSPGSVDALVWALSVLLVDERPLYPFMPIMPGPPVVETLPSLVPAFRSDRPSTGMAVAPWRR